MSYFPRAIDRRLTAWKADPDHRPLVIIGPPRVGKTTSISRFARETYPYCLRLDFHSIPNPEKLLKNGTEPDSVLKNLAEIVTLPPLEPGKTLIWIDGLERFPVFAKSLPDLGKDRRFDVICSGISMQTQFRRSKAIPKDHPSLTWMQMYSMSFPEFLVARGYDESFLDDLLDHMVKMEPFSEADLHNCQKLFHDYCLLGGMPQVLTRCRAPSSQNLTTVMKEQQDVLQRTLDAVAACLDPKTSAQISMILNSIVMQLDRDDRIFMLSRVSSTPRYPQYRNAFTWMEDSGIALQSFSAPFPNIEDYSSTDGRKFRIYFSDPGLMCATLPPESWSNMAKKRDFTICHGIVPEQAVAETLRKAGVPLFFFHSPSRGLIADFLICANDQIYPVNVGVDPMRTDTLEKMIEGKLYRDVHSGIALSEENIFSEGNVRHFPLFCAALLPHYLQTARPGPLVTV